jgi:glycosyltransferase involved in cell wall biosynthesis
MVAETRYDHAVASRSILLVAHVTPPTIMSAARRAAGLTKYLARLGHRVTVLTSVMWGSGGVPEAARTIRTRDLLATRLNWRRSNVAALKGEAAGPAAMAPSAVAAWAVPDLQLAGWITFALPIALRLQRSERFDCVITTSPPHSSHLIGLALQLRGMPWVADFRDGWTFESQRPPWALPSLDVLNRNLEHLVVSRADVVCAVTDPIANDLGARFGRSVSTVTNGFDPETLATRAEGVHKLLSPQRRSLVHTGNLAYGGRSLEPLLSALTRLRAASPAAMAKLEVIFIGPIAAAERDEVQRAGLGDCVRLTGPVPHETALAVQRAADGLLVVTGPRQSGVATGKIYEYLTAERPILVIGDDTAAAGIAESAAAGIAVARDDPDALAAALRLFTESPDELPRPRPAAFARYAYPALAAQMAEQVERAIATRGRPG